MQRTESETLEFKTSFGEWKEIIQTLCAFANKDGGTIIVGFDDSGDYANFHLGKNSLEDFVNKLKLNTDPVLYPSINVKKFAIGEIVEISIPASDFKPVFAFGKAFIRVGKSTLLLSASEIKELVKKYSVQNFDSLPTNVKLDELVLDKKALKIVENIHPAFSFPVNIKELGAVKQDVLLNAGYLCFCEKNVLFTNAIVKAARFKGDKPVTFLDMQEFQGGLISIVEDVMSFIKKHINMAVILEGNAQRKEFWDYPLSALREAVINAIVHRDYEDSGNIQIRIFDQSIEIWSPGLLPSSISIDRIGETNRSLPRNRLLADIFHFCGLIEKWGTGFSRILESCKEHPIEQPIFEHKQGALVLSFKKVNSNDSGQTVGKDVGKDVGKSVGKDVGKELNESQLLILDEIKKEPSITIPQLAKTLHATERTIERNISALKDMGVIVRFGGKKYGYWEIIEQNK